MALETLGLMHVIQPLQAIEPSTQPPPPQTSLDLPGQTFVPPLLTNSYLSFSNPRYHFQEALNPSCGSPMRL